MNGHADENGFDQFIADQQEHNGHDDMTDKELFNAIVNDGAIPTSPQHAACADNDGHDHEVDILDNLPENRQERLDVLLKNLPTEDLCRITKHKIPAFLRIDNDVKEQKDRLLISFREYMAFDMKDMQADVKESLMAGI